MVPAFRAVTCPVPSEPATHRAAAEARIPAPCTGPGLPDVDVSTPGSPTDVKPGQSRSPTRARAGSGSAGSWCWAIAFAFQMRSTARPADVPMRWPWQVYTPLFRARLSFATVRLSFAAGCPAGCGGADQRGDVFGGLAGELGEDAGVGGGGAGGGGKGEGVGVGGDGDGGQAEGVLDDFHVVPGGEQEGGGAVAQVVKPDGGQAGEVGDLLEHVGDGGGVQRGAVGVGELEPGLGPGVPGVFLFFLLPLPVGADAGDGVGVEGDLPFAGVGFGGALGGLPAELGDLPADGGDGAVQVGVGAAQPAALAAA